MDQQIIFLIDRLRELRETQLLHERYLRELYKISSKLPKEASAAPKLSVLSKLFATSAGQWLGGVLAMAAVTQNESVLSMLDRVITLLKLLL